jgi:hypothetical protein
MRDRLVTRPLDPGRDWWFYREPWALTAEVRAGIRPLDEASSRLVWNALIRRNQFVHPNQLPRGHWSRDTYRYGPNWMEVLGLSHSVFREVDSSCVNRPGSDRRSSQKS